ncbi:MAG TPA: stage III sporulation AC/AD family protein [Candidatus Pullichristensenella avicola]|nr:stage III sporulation AC/AD family protein [Candidatus Pullichristensenella avicola]
MEAVRIALLLLAAALACAVMRAQRPELAAGVALAAGAAALALLLPGLRQAAETLTGFAGAAGLDGGAALILRATGVSLIAEFAAGVCEDAGEKALAGRVELASRVTLFAMAAPLLKELLDLVTEALA